MECGVVIAECCDGEFSLESMEIYTHVYLMFVCIMLSDVLASLQRASLLHVNCSSIFEFYLVFLIFN